MLANIDLDLKDEPLTEAEYQAIKLHISNWRDLLIFKVLRNTGLRQSELLAVEARHCSFEGPEYAFLVKRAKDAGAKYEKVYLNPNLGIELRHYLSAEPREAGERVFKVSPRWLQKVFKKGSLAAVGRPVKIHSLRKLYIQTGLNGGLSIEEVAKLVGHKSISTTLNHYYDIAADRRREINERMPV